MKVALNETKVPNIFIDLRLSVPFIPDNIYQYFSMELSKLLNDKTLNKLLSKINGNFRFKIGVQGKKNKCHRQRS